MQECKRSRTQNEWTLIPNTFFSGMCEKPHCGDGLAWEVTLRMRKRFLEFISFLGAGVTQPSDGDGFGNSHPPRPRGHPLHPQH